MGRFFFFAVANLIYVINSHTKFGWISFNSKGEDNISDCDDARKYLEIFLFSKSLTYRMCLLVLRCLIYILKGQLHNSALASISAFTKCTGSTGIHFFKQVHAPTYP